jgi:hypothetical protein
VELVVKFKGSNKASKEVFESSWVKASNERKQKKQTEKKILIEQNLIAYF